MAHRAVLREVCRNVIRNPAAQCCGAVVILSVAAVASGGQRSGEIIRVARRT